MIRNLHRLLPFAVIAITAGPALAAPTSDAFVAGNAAAAVGDHAAAAAAFERSIEQAGWASSTLLDLGNAYAGTGQRGRAILAYERAQLLSPRDPAIVANLAHVRETAGVTTPEPSRLHAVLARLGSDEWSWIRRPTSSTSWSAACARSSTASSRSS